MIAAITGMGAVTPFGEGVEALVQGLEGGVPRYRLEGDPARLLPPGAARRMDRLSRAATACCLQAGRQAGLDIGILPDRVGLAFGTTYGDLEGLLRFLDRLDDKGPALANPMDFPNLLLGAAAGHACLAGGWRGPQWATCRPGRAGEVVAAVVLEPLPAALARGTTVLGTLGVAAPGHDLPAAPPLVGSAWGEVPADGVARLVVALLAVRGSLRLPGAPLPDRPGTAVVLTGKRAGEADLVVALAS